LHYNNKTKGEYTMKKGTKIIKTEVEVYNSMSYIYDSDEIWKDYCRDNDVDEDTPIDWDYIYDMRDWEWEDTLDTLISKFRDNSVILSGHLGLWNGRPQIANYYFYDIKEAIDKCLSSGDYWKVTYDNWGIHILVTHHDGTNCFTISPIKRYTDLSDYIVENFNPTKHKRFIQRINCLWE
jgi:hypothetical protein